MQSESRTLFSIIICQVNRYLSSKIDHGCDEAGNC